MSSVKSVLVDQQYNFRPQRLASLNLITFNNYVLNVIKKHSQIDVIYEY